MGKQNKAEQEVVQGAGPQGGLCWEMRPEKPPGQPDCGLPVGWRDESHCSGNREPLKVSEQGSDLTGMMALVT